MSTEPRTGIECREPERFALGRFDHVPDVDPHLVRHESQLVDQPDIDRSKGILHELSHLRFLGFHRDDLFEDFAIDINGLLGRHRRHSADNFGDIFYAIPFIPWIDPLGREC